MQRCFISPEKRLYTLVMELDVLMTCVFFETRERKKEKKQTGRKKQLPF